jgi:tetratricopeptide (TPR) repeat protein
MRTRGSTAAWLLPALLLALVAGCRQTPSWEDVNESGKQALVEGRLDEAEEHMLVALTLAQRMDEQDPRHVLALNNLGELYRVRDELSKAVQYYGRALKLRETAGGDPVELALGYSTRPACSRRPKRRSSGRWSCASRRSDRSMPSRARR